MKSPALATVIARLDALSLKERALVTAAAALVVYALWQTALMDPLTAGRARTAAEASARRGAIELLQAQGLEIIARSRRDPDAANLALRERYQNEAAELDREIAESAARLVPAEKMAAVLETVLRRSAGLAVIEVQGLGTTPLFDAPAPKPGTPPEDPGAWKHGVRITFAGSYLDALAYLHELESLPFGFFWDSFSLQVTEYPAAVTTIVVYTLSLDRRWIGV